MKRTVLTALGFTMVLLSACSDGGSNQKYLDAADCSGQTPTYTANVAPIVNGNCAISGCHNASSSKEGLDMQGYAAAKASFDDFDILCSVSHDAGCKAMPEGRPQLSDVEVLTLTCWAKSGFPE